MKTAAEVDQIIKDIKAQGLSKPDFVVRVANACIGWSYVFGARGEYCTPANRRNYYAFKKKETIKTKCKNFDGNIGCSGCKWYPGGKTRFFDCRGFTRWLFGLVDIRIEGAGATSQYNEDSNWCEKGPIENMPKDKVCCTFHYDKETKKMEHTLLYDGQGNYIHCSGEVKKCAISKYKATHYAIPKGLYDGGGNATMPSKTETVTYPTLREGANGDLVIQLQDLLAKAGSSLQIDGVFGSGTRSAVRAFQNKYGLAVDGIVGPKTWAKLIEVAGNVKVQEPVTDKKKMDKELTLEQKVDVLWAAYLKENG